MLTGSILQIYPFDFKPSAPPVGAYLLYAKTDNTVYMQDSSGNEYAFASVGFISELNGDVSAIGPGIAPATVNSVGGFTAAQIATAITQINNATASTTPNTVVLRDAFGNFSAATITANLIGAASANVLKSGDTMTGPLNINSAAGNALIVDTNVLVVDGALNRVGINKVNPTQALEVVGNILSSGTVTATNISGTNTGDVTVTDSNSVDLTLSGQNLTADVKTADSTLTITPTGLKVDTVANSNIAAGVDALKIGSGLISNTEFGYLDGVTSSIQDQINARTFPLTSASCIIYVDKSGNDSTADGTQFKPYLTVQAAMTSITDATTNKRYVIRLGPGNFLESTLTLKPWVWVVGHGRSSSRINVTTAPYQITLHPDWGTNTSRGGMVNIYCTGSTGLLADFVALGGSTSAVFEAQDTFFNGAVTFRGRTTADFVEYLRGYIFGTTTLSSIQGFFFQIVQLGPLILDTTGTDNCSVQLLGCTTSSITVNQTGTYSITPELTASSVQGSITATRSGSGALTISSDVSTIATSTVNLTGGATLNRLSDSKNLKYTPLTPADWSVPPVEVSTALDELAAYISGISGSSITALNGDVSATGPGLAAATVNSVGGSSAADINLATIDANAATATNTPSTIVKRDANGDFSANDLTVNTVNSVVVESHAARHLPSGADPLAYGIPVQISTSNFTGAADSFALSDHVHSHGNQTSGTLHAAATGSVNGFMSSTDKTKLDGSTATNTPSTLVLRDSSGNFSAGTITATLTGSATSFTGSLVGDVSGTQAATVVDSVGGKTAVAIATSVNDTQAATSANTSSTIVRRDVSGNISASQVSQSTAQLRGTSFNVNLVANPSATYTLTLPQTQGVAGTYLNNDGTGNLSWSSPQINIDGGAPDTVFVVASTISGGTP